MRFLIWRCVGILFLGLAAFSLAVMQGTYHWDYFFTYLFRDYMNIFWGFVLGLIGAAFFLSLEQEE